MEKIRIGRHSVQTLPHLGYAIYPSSDKGDERRFTHKMAHDSLLGQGTSAI